jgi:hypothetical protein
VARNFRGAALVTCAVLLVAAPALADVVHLKSGGRVEGVVADEGDALRVTHRFGTVVVKKADVAGIEKKATVEERYAERRRTADPADPDDLVELGHWCRENGWESQAVKEFEAALRMDADHRGAHTALGHEYFEGAWRTEREIMRLRGFVLFEGSWMTKEEVDLRKAAAAEEKRVRALERKLNSLFRRLAGPGAKEREKAHREIVTLARELPDPGLEQFAGEAKAYYDRAWEIVQSQLALLEVRATLATLKRPIPTFQTSLGAGSTPVNIQLPEMAVVSLGTTVVVPAGR